MQQGHYEGVPFPNQGEEEAAHQELGLAVRREELRLLPAALEPGRVAGREGGDADGSTPTPSARQSTGGFAEIVSSPTVQSL